MKIYVQIGEAASGHRIREYAVSKKECASIRERWRILGVFHGIEMTPVELQITPTRKGIIKFLNTETPTRIV